MIKKYFLWFVAAVAASVCALTAASCSDSDDDNTGGGGGSDEKPTVTLTAGTPTGSTLTFTITPQHATKCVYYYAEKTASAPTVDQLLNGQGTLVIATEASSIELKYLKAETTYVIYAAAANAKYKSDLQQIEMTTTKSSGGGGDEYEEENTTMSIVFYYGDTAKNGKGFYQMALATIPITNTGFTGEGRIYYFGMYSQLSTDAIPQMGNYNYDKDNTHAEWTMSAEDSFALPVTATADGKGIDRGDPIAFTDSKVTLTKSGSKYTAEAYVTLVNGEKIKLVGNALEFSDESAGEEQSIDNLTQNINFTPTKAQAYYYGDVYENNTTDYDINFTNAAGESVNIEFVGPKVAFADASFPEGTFNIASTAAANTCMTGDSYEENGSVYLIGTFYLGNQNKTAGLVTSGTVTITKSGANYTITLAGKTAKNFEVNASYTGAIPIQDKSSGGEKSYSTLTGDVNADFSACNPTAMFYGDYFKNGTGDLVIQLIPTPNANNSGMLIELLTSTPNSPVLETGTYTVTDTQAANTALPGSFDPVESNIYPTSYVHWNDKGQLTDFAPIKSGTITVSKSGNDYTLVFDMHDDASTPNHITGSWTGPITITDKTTANVAAQIGALTPSSKRYMSIKSSDAMKPVPFALRAAAANFEQPTPAKLLKIAR